MFVSMAHGPIFTYGILMNLKHKHIKDITIRKDQHKKIGDALRKATSIPKDNNITNLSIWHMRGYEELISNRIASLAYLGLMNH